MVEYLPSVFEALVFYLPLGTGKKNKQQTKKLETEIQAPRNHDSYNKHLLKNYDAKIQSIDAEEMQ